MAIIPGSILPSLLSVYDQLLELRSILVGHIVVKILIASFFVVSLLMSIALCVYWAYCTYYVLRAQGAELTEAEVEPMLWEKKLREQLGNFFNGGVWTLS